MRLSAYIKDLVYGANDGIVTTFAVVASVVGAGLEPNVILIVGFASLVADGFSMAASDYLASKSERDALRNNNHAGLHLASQENPLTAAAITFCAFLSAGSLPLLPYVFAPDARHLFLLTAAATGIALILIGAGRTFATGNAMVRSALEMLLIGGAAVSVAFVTGRFVAALM